MADRELQVRLVTLCGVLLEVIQWIDFPSPESLTEEWFNTRIAALRTAAEEARNATDDDSILAAVRSAAASGELMATFLAANPEAAGGGLGKWGPHFPLDKLERLRQHANRLWELGMGEPAAVQAEPAGVLAEGESAVAVVAKDSPTVADVLDQVTSWGSGSDLPSILKVIHSDANSESKMREVCGIDRRFLQKTSGWWAERLGVSDRAIRKTAFWRIDRRKLLRQE